MQAQGFPVYRHPLFAYADRVSSSHSPPPYSSNSYPFTYATTIPIPIQSSNHFSFSNWRMRRRPFTTISFSSEQPSDDLISDDDDEGFDFDFDLGGIQIEIEKLGNNCRRIRAKVPIDASLHTLWNILTDYERLPDFIPSLALSQLLHKSHNFARLIQIGQQNLAFGLKFKANGVVDCYEKDLESFRFGQKRDIEFEMIEGDFQLFQGKWSIQENSKGTLEENGSLASLEFDTTLSYVVDVKPKMWLPVRLVEGRLCKEIQMNLSCIREEAQRVSQKSLPFHSLRRGD